MRSPPPSISTPFWRPRPPRSDGGRRRRRNARPARPGRRVAIARDAAFSFIYPHVEAGWRAAGAELISFSPLADEAPPDTCDACWLPGGYPELHAGRIAGAGRFLAACAASPKRGRFMANAGGYMVLGASLIDADGATHAMAGLLSVETSFARRKMNLGYRGLCWRRTGRSARRARR